MKRLFSCSVSALCSLLAAQFSFGGGLEQGATINWLGGTAPAVDANVSWGVPWPKGAVHGAKQPRISHAGLKRFYYFLSGGDERMGDLLREQIDADLTFSYLQKFNNAHYLPTADGGYRLDFRADIEAPRPEQFAPRLTAADRKPSTRFGLEWMCYALNWTTEWERGGDQAWRAHVEADMRTMTANVDENGGLPGRFFDMLFGGPENMWEMEPMYDVPAFWTAFAKTCETVGTKAEGGQMTGPRLLAYAAFKKNDARLGRLAWEKLIGPGITPLSPPQTFSGANVVKPVTDPVFLGDAYFAGAGEVVSGETAAGVTIILRASRNACRRAVSSTASRLTFSM